jgi:hypothetical protein
MDKKFTFGLIALLGVSLFILGCDDSSDDSTEAAEQAATELAAEFGEDEAKADGTTVTLQKPATITKPISVEVGVTLNIGTHDLTVDTRGVLTIKTGAIIAGTGKIITDNTGTITIGTATGYTTDASGVAGDAFKTAADALAADSAELTNKGTVDLTAGEYTADLGVTGIGTVTLTTDDAPVPVPNVTITSGTAFVSAVTATGAGAITGTDVSTGNGKILVGDTFTLTIATSALQLADGDVTTGNTPVAPKCVVKFSGVEIKNNGLIKALDDFNIGVTTDRSYTDGG